MGNGIGANWCSLSENSKVKASSDRMLYIDGDIRGDGQFTVECKNGYAIGKKRSGIFATTDFSRIREVCRLRLLRYMRSKFHILLHRGL